MAGDKRPPVAPRRGLRARFRAGGSSRERRASLAVFAGYSALSFAYWGWRLLPHPGRELLGANGQSDAVIYIWSFAWWPHAILHWTNPFFSHVVYAPTGINLSWVTSVPGLAVLFSPLTLLVGPSASYNVAALLLPALSAWSAYRLLHYLSGSIYAALVGGYIYGFSGYMLGQQFASHLNLTAVFVVPLAAHVLLRFLRRELDARALAWRLGLIVAFQISISTEVALTLTLMIALGLLLALATPLRARIRSSLAPIAVGYLLATVLAAPLLYYTLSDFGSATVYTAAFSADPLNLVVPTSEIGWSGRTFASIASTFPGDEAERDSYLGLPALLIAALLVWRRPRDRAVRFLLGAFALATLLSLGSSLELDGRVRLGWLPWSAFRQIKGLEQVIPSRLALYAALAVAVMVALWISSTPGKIFRRPYVLPILAVAALVPPVWSGAEAFEPERVSFFSDGLVTRCIPRNETLLIFPFGHWGESLLWQAESGFWFKIAEGELGHSDQPPNFVSDPTIYALTYGYPAKATSPSMSALLALAKRRQIDRVVTTGTYPDAGQIHRFGPVSVGGGVYVAPGCGSPSLVATRAAAG